MCGKVEANTHIFWINKDRDLKSMCPKRFKVTLSFATWMHSLYVHILIPTHREGKRKKEMEILQSVDYTEEKKIDWQTYRRLDKPR